MTEFCKTYGSALFALAQEEKLDDEMLSELNGVCALLRENSDYVRVIDSRAIAKSERLGLLDDAFKGKVHPYLLNFMKILCERGAFGQLFGCGDAYLKEYNEAHGIIPARAVTAVALTEEQKARLISALEKKTGKTIRLETVVDPSLRSGMRVEMEGRRYDNTVASRLDHLRQALLSGV